MTDPLGETTIVLGEEFDRLDERADVLASKVATADPEAQGGQALKSILNELDQQGYGVAYLLEEYGPDATVTIRGMSAGEFARVEDRIADIRATSDSAGGNPGSARNVWAASGLVDAPFLDADADSYEDKLGAVADLPVGVAKWLEARINEETSIEGNWKSSSRRIEAFRESNPTPASSTASESPNSTATTPET